MKQNENEKYFCKTLTSWIKINFKDGNQKKIPQKPYTHLHPYIPTSKWWQLEVEVFIFVSSVVSVLLKTVKRGEGRILGLLRERIKCPKCIYIKLDTLPVRLGFPIWRAIHKRDTESSVKAKTLRPTPLSTFSQSADNCPLTPYRNYSSRKNRILVTESLTECEPIV